MKSSVLFVFVFIVGVKVYFQGTIEACKKDLEQKNACMFVGYNISLLLWSKRSLPNLGVYSLFQKEIKIFFGALLSNLGPFGGYGVGFWLHLTLHVKLFEFWPKLYSTCPSWLDYHNFNSFGGVFQLPLTLLFVCSIPPSIKISTPLKVLDMRHWCLQVL